MAEKMMTSEERAERVMRPENDGERCAWIASGTHQWGCDYRSQIAIEIRQAVEEAATARAAAHAAEVERLTRDGGEARADAKRLERAVADVLRERDDARKTWSMTLDALIKAEARIRDLESASATAGWTDKKVRAAVERMTEKLCQSGYVVVPNTPDSFKTRILWTDLDKMLVPHVLAALGAEPEDHARWTCWCGVTGCGYDTKREHAARCQPAPQPGTERDAARWALVTELRRAIPGHAHSVLDALDRYLDAMIGGRDASP